MKGIKKRGVAGLGKCFDGTNGAGRPIMSEAISPSESPTWSRSLIWGIFKYYCHILFGDSGGHEGFWITGKMTEASSSY